MEGGIMRGYQLEGLNWLLRIHSIGINGILADEMGLGKTVQSISLIAYLHPSSYAHLVVVPMSTLNT